MDVTLGVAGEMPGLFAYGATTEAKLGPTLEAADGAGVAEVLCVDEVLQDEAVEQIARRVLKPDSALRISRWALPSLAAATNFPPQIARNRWGVYAPHESGVEGAAEFAHTLERSGLLARGVSVHSLEATQILRLKDRFRDHITHVAAPSLPDVLSLWHKSFDVNALSVENLRAAAAPDLIVVKPTNGSGSKGVELIDLTSPDANARLRSAARTLAYLRGNVASRAIDVHHVQVESFVLGEEFSVEGFFLGGQTYVGAIHWKPDMHRDLLQSGNFLEGRFVTLPHSVPEYGLLERINGAILASIPGLGDTVFHAEYRIDATTGKVFPIEIAGRPAGGTLVESAAIFSGVSLYDAGVRLALGLPVTKPAGPFGLAAEGVIFPTQDGILKRLTLQLPGEAAVEATRENRGEVAEKLNRWLAQAPRAAVRKMYERFPQEVPFDSPLRHALQHNFSSNGIGLDAVVRQMNVWSKPGDPIIGHEGVYLGGLLLASRSGSSDMATLADLNAAMGLALAMFHSEVEPLGN